MKVERYIDLKQLVIDAGYSDEIDWQTNLQPCENAAQFKDEAIWVILNSGMKEQISRGIWRRIREAWAAGKPTSSAFNHKGKVAAIDFVCESQGQLFFDYVRASDKIEFLQTIPFIGKITCWHLAKNLGYDCVKPDRHLVRIANEYNTTPDQLCEQISTETGDKKCVVDIVLWRAANLKFI